MNRILIWIIAIVITVAAGIYQRVTGPTYPLPAAVTIDGEKHSFGLIRSHGGEGDAELSIDVPGDVEGVIHYRRYKTDDEWTSKDMVRDGDELTARLPHQPPAGKLEYYLTFSAAGQTVDIGSDKPVVIRFKGGVPAAVLIPHIAFMFFGMLISNVAGLMAIARDEQFRFYTIFALILLTIGGMILGPIVQLYAFDDLWTGVPFGWDLTDNKTLIAFLAYLVAVVGNIKTKRPYLTIAAAVVVLLVFSIPHSVFGSEFDYTTGVIKQASLLPNYTMPYILMR
jgi:hypothetical protein